MSLLKGYWPLIALVSALVIGSLVFLVSNYASMGPAEFRMQVVDSDTGVSLSQCAQADFYELDRNGSYVLGTLASHRFAAGDDGVIRAKLEKGTYGVQFSCQGYPTQSGMLYVKAGWHSEGSIVCQTSQTAVEKGTITVRLLHEWLPKYECNGPHNPIRS